MALAEF